MDLPFSADRARFALLLLALSLPIAVFAHEVEDERRATAGGSNEAYYLSLGHRF